jgi:hypothetical protein
MDWGWALTIRQADKTHQEIRKMFKQGIGPQRIGSHDELLEDCTKDLMLNFATLEGSPTPMIQKCVTRDGSIYCLLLLDICPQSLVHNLSPVPVMYGRDSDGSNLVQLAA